MGSDHSNLHSYLLVAGVSIHAPTWGATPRSPYQSAKCPFQSTLPHGERLVAIVSPILDSTVSIHAPTWGATASMDEAMTDVMFQSTLPHGERQSEQRVVA